jgi:dUTP pyrophosphatase
MMNETPTFKFALLEGLSEQFLPTKAHPNDTGWDVKAAETFTLYAGQYVKIPLGFRMFAPLGFWVELRPRSSSFAKKQLHCLYGVIDEGYENQLILAAQFIPGNSARGQYLEIKAGDAVGQIIPIRRQEMLVEQVSNEEYEKLTQERKGSRGTGGFGSTTK